MFEIQFLVSAFSEPGDSFRVVGNLHSLGNWNPLKGLNLLQIDDNEWESQMNIEISDQFKLEFKIVKFCKEGTVLWEQLPNNSNRKFRSKGDSQLRLKWSNPHGNIANLPKSSFRIQGLPGVIVENIKKSGLIQKKKKFDPDLLAKRGDSSSSSSSDEEDAFTSVVSQKRSADIRSLTSVRDIETIFYQTTQLEKVSNRGKKVKVYIISYSWEEKDAFCERLLEEIKNIHESEEIYFKWLFFQDMREIHGNLSKKNSFLRISVEKFESASKIQISKYKADNAYFIFIDLKSTFMIDVSQILACLYLPASQFNEYASNIQDFKEFKFVCFDSLQKNQQLHQILKNRSQSWPKNEEIQQLHSKNVLQAVNYDISLHLVIKQLDDRKFEQKSLNTVSTLVREEVAQRIVAEKSILIIDSSLSKTDPIFFEKIISHKAEKRFIIIVHQENLIPERLQRFKKKKNVFLVFNSFRKFFFLQKMYEPLKKHDQILQLVKMKLKMLEPKFKFEEKPNQIILSPEGNLETQKLTHRLINDLENIIKKTDYFSISTSKSKKIKISWNLSHQMRLLKTICKIKFMEEGEIGGFFLVTEKQEFENLVEECQTLRKIGKEFLTKRELTPIEYFGYGSATNSKLRIQVDEENIPQKNGKGLEFQKMRQT